MDRQGRGHATHILIMRRQRAPPVVTDSRSPNGSFSAAAMTCSSDNNRLRGVDVDPDVTSTTAFRRCDEATTYPGVAKLKAEPARRHRRESSL